MDNQYLVTYKSGKEEKKTELEIRNEFIELSSAFKQMLFRLKKNEMLYHNDTYTTFKRVS